LHAGKAINLVDVIEPYEAETLAHTGYGLEQIEGMGIGLLGRVEDVEFQVLEQFVVIGDEGQVDRTGLLHRRVVNTFSHALPVGCVGDLLADLGQVVFREWVVCTGDKSSERWRIRWVRRRKRSRVARLSAGSTEACGSMPPRSKAAICCESILSFLALPPWRAFI